MLPLLRCLASALAWALAAAQAVVAAWALAVARAPALTVARALALSPGGLGFSFGVVAPVKPPTFWSGTGARARASDAPARP